MIDVITFLIVPIFRKPFKNLHRYIVLRSVLNDESGNLPTAVHFELKMYDPRIKVKGSLETCISN